MNKAISRRLAALQAFADRQRPAVVAVTFMDGSTATTDPAGALDFLKSGKVDVFQSDHPVYSPWAALLTTLCHPVANRRIEDFE